MANEKRMISVEKTVKELEGEIYWTDSTKAAIRAFLRTVPAVDAVEVVRCKDCKHWHEETGWCYHHSHFIDSEGEACHPWESGQWKMFDADDFCSCGERKDNV